MIRCPVGHWFSGPIGSLTWGSKNEHDPGTAAAAFTARHGSLPRTHDGRDSGGGFALPEFPAEPGQAVRHPNCAPAFFLGRPAHQWITAMRLDHRHAPQPRRTQPPHARRYRRPGGNATSRRRPGHRRQGRTRPRGARHCAAAKGIDRHGSHQPGHMRSSPAPHRASAPPSPPAWPPTATTFARKARLQHRGTFWRRTSARCCRPRFCSAWCGGPAVHAGPGLARYGGLAGRGLLRVLTAL